MLETEQKFTWKTKCHKCKECKMKKKTIEIVKMKGKKLTCDKCSYYISEFE